MTEEVQEAAAPPSIDDLIAGVIMAIDDEILPALGNPKAQATGVMMKSMLQTVRQMLPVQDAILVDEHNTMTAVLRDVATKLDGIDGPAVDRVRNRAATLGQNPDVEAPPDLDPVVTSHAELSIALGDTMVDLDELQTAGTTLADEALQIVRAHLGARYLRRVATISVGEGLLGRG